MKRLKLPSIEHQDKRADKRYFKRLIEEGETREWARHMVTRFQQARIKDRIARFSKAA